MFNKIDTELFDETLVALQSGIVKFGQLRDNFKNKGQRLANSWGGIAGKKYAEVFLKTQFNISDQVDALITVKDALSKRYNYYQQADMCGSNMFQQVSDMFSGKK